MIELLTDQETDQLRKPFECCEPCHYDDLELADYGPRRALYDFITKELNLHCDLGRGPAYRRAALMSCHCLET